MPWRRAAADAVGASPAGRPEPLCRTDEQNLKGEQMKYREFTAVNTPDEWIFCREYQDGRIEKIVERRRISTDEVEVITHCNRDRNGNYYTTRHVCKISEGAVINPNFK